MLHIVTFILFETHEFVVNESISHVDACIGVVRMKLLQYVVRRAEASTVSRFGG